MNGNQGAEGLFKPILRRVGGKVPPKAEKAVESPRNALFGNLFEVSVDDRLADAVMSLSRKYSDVVSAVRRADSAVCRSVVQSLKSLVSNTFLYSHDWDSSWLSRVAERYPVESLRFKDEYDVLGRCEDVLSYCSERKGEGFWYPRTKGGKVAKHSLAEFLVCGTRSGKCWSPFLELVCCDLVTPNMLYKVFPSSVQTILEDMYGEVWFTRTFGSKVSYLRGAIEFCKWYDSVKADIVNVCEANKVHLGTLGGMLSVVREANKSTHCVYPTFVSDNNDSYSRLRDWCSSELKIKIPDRMHK